VSKDIAKKLKPKKRRRKANNDEDIGQVSAAVPAASSSPTAWGIVTGPAATLTASTSQTAKAVKAKVS
jgi:hypothetical protein